jgi:hypothetical protein
MASRESFGEHILNDEYIWEYSAIDIQDKRHRHRCMVDDRGYLQSQSSRWRDAFGDRASSRDQDEEFYNGQSSLYHESNHSLDKSPYRHVSKDDLGLKRSDVNGRSSGASNSSRSCDTVPKSDSMTEFIRQFFD